MKKEHPIRTLLGISQETQVRLLRLADFWNGRDMGKMVMTPLPGDIALKVDEARHAPVLAELAEELHELEMLELEQMLLEARLRKYDAAPKQEGENR